MIEENQAAAIACDRSSGPFLGMTDRDIKKIFKVHGSVVCRPIQEKSSLANALQMLTQIDRVVISVPDHENDPAAPLRGVSAGVDVVVNINATFRKDRNWRDRIGDLLQKLKSTDAKIMGKDESGSTKTVPINDEIFALDNFDMAKLIAAEHLKQDGLCSAPIFADLNDFMIANPRLFGA